MCLNDFLCAGLNTQQHKLVGMQAHAAAVHGPGAGHCLLALSYYLHVFSTDLDVLSALEGGITCRVQRE